jgi:hypothetical protein
MQAAFLPSGRKCQTWTADCPFFDNPFADLHDTKRSFMQQFSFLPSLRFLTSARFGAFAVVLFATLYQPVDGVAQALNPDYLRSMNMRAIGPATMSGRVTAIASAPNNPNVLYIGAASGGVWRSKSGGTRWEPIFDAAPTQSVGSIALNPQNPDEIWVGTGEGNPRNSQNFGAGIFKSIDGGRTWTCKGLTETRSIHRIRLHRDNPDILWAAAMGSGNGPSTERACSKAPMVEKTGAKYSMSMILPAAPNL